MYDVEWELQQQKKVDKKYLSKGMPIYVLHKRTCNSACEVIRHLQDIAFEDIDISLYVLCKDSGFAEFSRKYEGALEFAKQQPEKFVQQLYGFYTTTAKFILSNHYLENFLAFLSYFAGRQKESDGVAFHVYSAYVDLLMQQMEFLRPNKFDYNATLVGVDTEGRPIVIRDPFPASDLPLYELTQMHISGSPITSAVLESLYARYGYKEIHTLDDVDSLRLRSQIYQNNVIMLSAYINEYTFDILPEIPIPAQMFPEEWPKRNVGNLTRGGAEHTQLTKCLTRRKRTLPGNGLIVRFRNSRKFHRLLLKELFANHSVVLLFRMTTDTGDISGWYDPMKGAFYSPFSHTQGFGEDVHFLLWDIVLWAYAAYSCQTELAAPTSESYLQLIADRADTEVSFSAIAGVLRPVLENGGEGAKLSSQPDKYETRLTSIAGYVRKLPTGQKASEEAIMEAERIGLELEPDETFVKPFMRASWMLRQPD